MKEQLCRAFCDELIVRNVPMGLAVSTAFSLPDGDRVGFYVKKQPQVDVYELQDSGLIFPSLEANGLNLKNKNRREAFNSLLNEYGIHLDEDDREFRLPNVHESDLPAASLRFVSFLLRVYDLLLLNEERVASTFRSDVEQRLRQALGEQASIEENAPISSDLAEFMPDFVIRASDRNPVGVYLGTSDARILEALFVQMRAIHEVKNPVSIIALLENDRAITKKVRQQASNRLTAVTHYRGDEAAAISRITREAIGTGFGLH